MADKDFPLLIKQIHDLMEKTANEQLREKDLTFSQLRILSYINECDGNMATLKDIEKHFLIAQPTVVGLIKRMESKGFLSVCTDDTDRRVKNAFLTEKGAAYCMEVSQRQKEMRQRLTRTLSLEEADELYRLLMEIYRNLVH